jgi:ubiquinone biosynthesis protein
MTTSLPGELTQVLQRVRAGSFNVSLEQRRLDTIVNRMVYGILTAALFLGSCPLPGRKIPPVYGEKSIFGAVGCLLYRVLWSQRIRAIKKYGNLGGS